MTFEEAINLVHTEFETRYDDENCEIIRVNWTYDGSNELMVAVYQEKDAVVLTDLGATKDIFYQVNEDQWIDVCTRNGYIFNRGCIEHSLNDISDVHNFIEFLDSISDIFYPKGN